MWRNYFTIAIRQLQKNKVYALINITGLGVGLGATLLIFLVIRYEIGYDKFHSNKDRIYRVVTNFANKSNGEISSHLSAVPVPLPNALRSSFPQIQKVAAVWNIGGAQIHIPEPGKERADEKRFKENNGLFFAEPGLFEMFDYKWLVGNAKELKEPNTAVLTRSLANAFFGDWRRAVGRTIELWSFRIPLRIVGVFEDLPENTDMQVRLGGSYATFRSINEEWFKSNNWEQYPWSSECYLMLPPNMNASQIRKLLPQFVQRHYILDPNGSTTKPSLNIQPLSSIHLDERYSTFKGDALTKKELWALALIGIFLLIVACINFINLATSQSLSRAKEVGVRKVLGSTRVQLLKQFLNETAVLTIISIALGYFVSALTLPLVRDLLQKPLSLNVINQPVIIFFLVFMSILVTILAGLYPGFVLSRFNPSEAIKSKVSTSMIGGVSVRRGLVVLQFVIAQFLIIGTLVVIRQMDFFKSRPLGFDKNAVALLELPSNEADQLKLDYLKAQVLNIPGISSASFCMDAPASFGSNSQYFYYSDDPKRKDFPVNLQYADTGFANTFKIGIVAGRMPYASDTIREVVVNETLVRKLGLSSADEIIGKSIAFDIERNLPVVGVLKDYNHKPLKHGIEPVVITTHKPAYNFIAMRFEPSRMQPALAKLHRLFTGIYPTYIYDLNFLDERIVRFYASEAKTSRLFRIAAIIAIFISCMGLYGLVSFMTVQKTKEVGIRKVLGASIQAIVHLFTKEFIVLIGIAFLIAAPLGYLFMENWLSGFHYRIDLGPGIFILALILSLFVASITIGYKAIAAARANPIKNLKTE